MGESWKDKTVSLGNVDKEEFESEMGDITVSENGIRVDFSDTGAWEKIIRNLGQESILRDVRWREVEGLDKTQNHLYYPHIDVQTERGLRRIYFKKGETELMEACLNAARRFRRAFMESGSGSRQSYTYDAEEQGDEEVEGQTAEDVRITEAGEDGAEPEEKETEEEEDESIDEAVEKFMES